MQCRGERVYFNTQFQGMTHHDGGVKADLEAAGHIHIYETESGECQSVLSLPYPLYSLAFQSRE